MENKLAVCMLLHVCFKNSAMSEPKGGVGAFLIILKCVKKL